LGFVGNYALCGFSPQIDGMPVIHKKILTADHPPSGLDLLCQYSIQ